MQGPGRDLVRASRLPHLRPCRMLRGFTAHTRSQAFQHDWPPDDRLPRAQRDLELVLCPSSLFRARTGAAAKAPFRAGGAVRPSDGEMTTVPRGAWGDLRKVLYF